MIRILRETTGVKDGFTYHPHLYYVNDADKLVWFQVADYSRGLDKYTVPKKFYRSGRKFEKIGEIEEEKDTANTVEFTGTKGDKYTVDLDENTCTCKGYQFRGGGKHIDQALEQVL